MKHPSAAQSAVDASKAVSYEIYAAAAAMKTLRVFIRFLYESFLCAYSSYSTVFEVWGYCITFFADVKQKFYRTALSAQHLQQLRGGVRDAFRTGNFQFFTAAEPPADGDQRQTGVAGRGHIYLAVAHIHGIFRVDAES